MAERIEWRARRGGEFARVNGLACFVSGRYDGMTIWTVEVRTRPSGLWFAEYTTERGAKAAAVRFARSLRGEP